MTEAKYQDIKESMCCMYCASYESRKSVCIESMQKVKMIGKPCKDFELGAMSAYYHGIETNEDYTYFSERFRKEQNNG
jgi:hypothetical protein